jgi:hypothetical protein
MLLTNHTLTGALIGLTVQNPVLIAPLGFLSHFVCDIVPHTGFKGMNFKNGPGRTIAFVDCGVSLAIYLLIIGLRPEIFWPATIGAFFATLPDLIRIPGALWDKDWDVLQPFHNRIQWSESPQGFVVDVVWAASMLYFIFNR